MHVQQQIQPPTCRPQHATSLVCPRTTHTHTSPTQHTGLNSVTASQQLSVLKAIPTLLSLPRKSLQASSSLPHACSAHSCPHPLPLQVCFAGRARCVCVCVTPLLCPHAGHSTTRTTQRVPHHITHHTHQPKHNTTHLLRADTAEIPAAAHKDTPETCLPYPHTPDSCCSNKAFSVLPKQPATHTPQQNHARLSCALHLQSSPPFTCWPAPPSSA